MGRVYYEHCQGPKSSPLAPFIFTSYLRLMREREVGKINWTAQVPEARGKGGSTTGGPQHNNDSLSRATLNKEVARKGGRRHWRQIVSVLVEGGKNSRRRKIDV